MQEYERELEPEERTPGLAIVNQFLNDMLKENELNSGKLFVAEVAGKVVGFINALVESEPGVHSTVQKWLYISDLAVLPAAQGSGVAQSLMDSVEEYARELQLPDVHVGTLIKNARARHFYAKMGFREFEVTCIKKISG